MLVVMSDSMVRDPVEVSVKLGRELAMKGVSEKAAQNAEERILDLLLPPVEPSKHMPFDLREYRTRGYRPCF